MEISIATTSGRNAAACWTASSHLESLIGAEARGDGLDEIGVVVDDQHAHSFLL